MTRENKLALVVGFGLMLLVGILVSDHFSAAQTAEAEDVSAHLNQRHIPPIASRTSEQPAVIPASNVKATTASRKKAVGAPVPPRRMASSGGEIVMRTPERAVASTSQTKTVMRNQEVTTRSKVKRHKVRSNDTLSDISTTYYGTGRHWIALAKFNKASLPNPDVLRVGIVLQIPEVESLYGSPVATPSRIEPVVTSSTKYVIRVVMPGETLSDIAQETLGSSRRWSEIFQLNKDILSHQDQIREGMKLKVPSR